jgi:hypothetical protein
MAELSRGSVTPDHLSILCCVSFKTKLGLGEQMVPNGNGFLVLLVSLSLSLTPDAPLQNTQSKAQV